MDEIKIQDNGESEVQVATIGKVVGSDYDGNPVEQNFSEEALKKIAETQTEEILVDEDHSSEKGGCTSAKGWLSKLKFVEGKGLFGTIKWTDIGRKLVENRVFRWLSPAWLLNESKEPEYMTSCSLTNKPAQMGRIDPIVNSQPKETISKENIDMTVDEVKALVSEMIAEALAKKEEEVKEEVVEEKKEEVANEEVKTEKTEVEDKTACNEEVVEQKVDEKVEQPVAEQPKEEEKKEEEIIKIEALNSAPTPTLNADPEWKKLSGKAFTDYIESGKYRN